MTEPYQRLRKARESAGYETASAAAEAMGVNIPTYIHHENGTNGLSRAGERYARFFRISLEWLLQGYGTMRGTKGVLPVVGFVGAGAVVCPIDHDTIDLALDYLDISDLDDLSALKVQGDSQYPRFLSGEYIIFRNEPAPPEGLIGRYCVVDCADGRRLVKMLRKCAKAGLFRLESHNAPPEDDIAISQAFVVRGVILV